MHPTLAPRHHLRAGLLVGFEVITKVPADPPHPADVGRQLYPRHRPRRRHVIAATADDPLGYALASSPRSFATMNVVGGYV